MRHAPARLSTRLTVHVVIVLVVCTAAVAACEHHRLSVAFTVALLLAGSATVAVALRVGMQPVEQLADAAEAIAAGDCGRRVEAHGFLETRRLALSFNAMVDGLVTSREAALQAARIKSQFLATMSHEIRTPLHGLLGMAELLESTSLDPTQRDFVATLNLSGQALLSVIGDILDMSTLEAGRLHLESRPFDPRRAVEDVSELFAASAQRKGLDLACVIDPHLPGSVVGDACRLKQVLGNLVGNAIKFAERGSVVVTVMPCDRARRPDRFRFEVRDDGPGISEAAAARLFEPFSQADGSTTRRFGGTGLGLAICKQLVVAMKGTIGVTSRGTSGSTFWFEIVLPLESPSRDAVGPREFADLHALVVDPAPASREGTLAQLRTLGFEALGCDGEPAARGAIEIAAALERRFDAVILDGQFLHASGERLSSWLRREPRFRPRSLVVLEPLISLEQSTGEQAADLDILGKPVRLARLRELFRERFMHIHASAHELSNRSVAARGAHFLIAEDNPVNQKVLCRMLERAGHSCTIVADGAEAVKRSEQERYDLVLMDCHMPVMDGYEATRHIRTRERGRGTARLPILAMTANALSEDRTRCLSCGMDAYLTKPITADELLAAVAPFLN